MRGGVAERERAEAARSASGPTQAPTVTTPGGIVADASTGEVLEPIRPDDPGAEPAETPEPERQDVQDAVGMAEVNPAASVHVDTKDEPAAKAPATPPAPAPAPMAAAPAAPVPAPAPAAPRADEPATLKLGVICERLGFTVTADFLADVLHIRPAKVEKTARLYTERQFRAICQQLQAHISAMAELYTAEVAA